MIFLDWPKSTKEKVSNSIFFDFWKPSCFLFVAAWRGRRNRWPFVSRRSCNIISIIILASSSSSSYHQHQQHLSILIILASSFYVGVGGETDSNSWPSVSRLTADTPLFFDANSDDMMTMVRMGIWWCYDDVDDDEEDAASCIWLSPLQSIMHARTFSLCDISGN